MSVQPTSMRWQDVPAARARIPGGIQTPSPAPNSATPTADQSDQAIVSDQARWMSAQDLHLSPQELREMVNPKEPRHPFEQVARFADGS